MAAATARQPARRHRLPARSSRALRARRRELTTTRRASGSRLHSPALGLARLRRRRALVQAGRAPHRPRRTRQRKPAVALRDVFSAIREAAAGLRAPDPLGFLDARRGADRRETRIPPCRCASPRARPAEPERRGLYPAGEGAGYAGGIASAGVDGIEGLCAGADLVGVVVGCGTLRHALPDSACAASSGRPTSPGRARQDRRARRLRRVGWRLLAVSVVLGVTLTGE